MAIHKWDLEKYGKNPVLRMDKEFSSKATKTVAPSEKGFIVRYTSEDSFFTEEYEWTPEGSRLDKRTLGSIVDGKDALLRMEYVGSESGIDLREKRVSAMELLKGDLYIEEIYTDKDGTAHIEQSVFDNGYWNFELARRMKVKEINEA